MEIENVPIRDIVPYESNPRKNEKAIDVVAKSIKEFGFKVPVILDDKNVIVAGHTRVKAAFKLGLTEVPVVYASDLNEEQIKAFRIMDNKSQEYSEWDDNLLREEFQKLKDSGFDLDLTGFSKEEVDSELKLNEVENINLFDERHKVIMLCPPESPRLKERTGFYCKDIKDYKKIKDYFDDGGKLSVERILDFIK